MHEGYTWWEVSPALCPVGWWHHLLVRKIHITWTVRNGWEALDALCWDAWCILWCVWRHLLWMPFFKQWLTNLKTITASAYALFIYVYPPLTGLSCWVVCFIHCHFLKLASYLFRAKICANESSHASSLKKVCVWPWSPLEQFPFCIWRLEWWHWPLLSWNTEYCKPSKIIYVYIHLIWWFSI